MNLLDGQHAKPGFRDNAKVCKGPRWVLASYTPHVGAHARPHDYVCHHRPHPTPFRATVRSSPESISPSLQDINPSRTLYGSRTGFGQELLRLLIDAPDVTVDTAAPSTTRLAFPDKVPNPEASEPASENQPTAQTAVISASTSTTCSASAFTCKVASLVKEVAALMVSHRDLAALRKAMEVCQVQVNSARAGSGGGGGRGAVQGPLKRTASVGNTISPSGSVPRIRGGLPGASRGLASRPPESVSGASPDEKVAAHGSMSAASPSSPQLLASGPGTATAATTATAAAVAQQRSCNSREWEWVRVRRVVVIGLGSLGSYQTAVRSGRQTAAESTRAAARLYQLALSLVMSSAAVLPGLGQSPGDTATAAIATSVAGVTTASAAAAPALHAAPAPLLPTLEVSYYDPEYLPWDMGLISSLHQRGGAADVITGFGHSLTVVSNATMAPAAALTAHVPTLFYAPCCPRELYDEIVRHNLSADTIHNVALVGNSLRAQADTALLVRALGGGAGFSYGGRSRGGGVGGASLGGLAPPVVSGGGLGSVTQLGPGGGLTGDHGQQRGEGRGEEAEDGEVFVGLVEVNRVVEVLLPDFAAHGVATALHLFV